MNQREPGRILVVDDEDKDLKSAAIGFRGVAIIDTQYPKDVLPKHLTSADLVLMDYWLKVWPERDALAAIAYKPANGLALAAVLREHADGDSDSPNGHTAFAIHSGHLGDLSKRLHCSPATPHLVARLNNIEWVFAKDDATRFDRASALARDVRAASAWWESRTESNLYLRAVVAELLAMPAEVDWTDRAFDEVVTCQPPTASMVPGGNALLVIRWLLHGILPYPTFLWDRHWTAAALRITPAFLDTVMAGDSRLASELKGLVYEGLLDDFDGTRWWRAGVEQFAWSIRADGARSAEAFHAVLEQRAGQHLERLDLSSPAVTLNEDLVPTSKVVELESVVRLVPDLWPAYADAALADLDLVAESDVLGAIVHPLDRDRVAERREELA